MTLRLKIAMSTDWDSTKGIEEGIAEIATDVQKRAVILAPRDTGALRTSGRITRLGAFTYSIIFGSDRVPYARRRHFENEKNPQTLGYLAKAADSINRSDKKKYFRNKI